MSPKLLPLSTFPKRSRANFWSDISSDLIDKLILYVDKSNEVIALLSQKFSSQPYWAAKSLLLMAKNFQAVKDAFQATYILESLIVNYKQFPEISKEGETLLNQIKEKQAEQNASLLQPNVINEIQ